MSQQRVACSLALLASVAACQSMADTTTASASSVASAISGNNPLFRDKFTADPAPLVVGDRLYLYTGHDEATRDQMFNMREWLVYSTTDMRNWTDHGPIMRVSDFKWAKADAWASQAIQKNGKFWLHRR